MPRSASPASAKTGKPRTSSGKKPATVKTRKATATERKPGARVRTGKPTPQRAAAKPTTKRTTKRATSASKKTTTKTTTARTGAKRVVSSDRAAMAKKVVKMRKTMKWSEVQDALGITGSQARRLFHQGGGVSTNERR